MELPRQKRNRGVEVREARFAGVFLAQSRMARKYPNTPWSFVLKQGWMMTFRKDVRIIEPERRVRKKTPKETEGKGKDGKKKPPPKPPTPKPKPADGPRPGSSGAGPVTGGK